LYSTTIRGKNISSCLKLSKYKPVTKVGNEQRWCRPIRELQCWLANVAMHAFTLPPVCCVISDDQRVQQNKFELEFEFHKRSSKKSKFNIPIANIELINWNVSCKATLQWCHDDETDDLR